MVHELEPARGPVFVIEPAEHPIQNVDVELSEYWPFGQATHVVAPAAVPVFVFEPSSHALQSTLPMAS
jgi:hypothetical protein